MKGIIAESGVPTNGDICVNLGLTINGTRTCLVIGGENVT